MTDSTSSTADAGKAVVQAWLEKYLAAWASNNESDIRALFTEDGVYSDSPLDPEPWIGQDAVVAGWLAERDEPGEWTFEGAPLAYDDGIGLVEGRTVYADGRTYANLWVIAFAADGRASSFTEWYMSPRPAG